MAAVFSSTTQVKSNWMKLPSPFSKKTKEAAIENSYVTCNPTFYFDDKVEDKYKWVLKENFFARDSVEMKTTFCMSILCLRCSLESPACSNNNRNTHADNS